MRRIGRCKQCGDEAVDRSRHPKAKYCSKRCFGLAQAAKGTPWLKPGANEFNRGKAPKGEAHWNWKGNDVKPQAARSRTRKAFPIGPCNRCGIAPDQARVVRHHKDRNPRNNEPSNIERLCARCHTAEHFR